MIDITPYEQRLTWLKEWIDIRVNSWLLRDIVRLFEETGMLISIHRNDPAGWSFEEYYKYKQSIQ